MAGFRHISTRLIVWVLGGGAVTLLATGLYQQQVTRRIVLEQAAARTAAVSNSVKEELQGVLRSVETSVLLAAAHLSDSPPTDRGEIEPFLHQLLATNARIYGTTVAFEPAAAPGAAGHFAPYLHRQDPGFNRVDLAAPGYAYWRQDWFRQPLARNGPVWVEPYFDAGAGNIQMVTYAVPFHRPGPDGPIPAGVVTADIALGWLKRVAESNQIGRNGFVIIFSGSGRIITHPETKHILTESLATLAAKYDRAEFRHLQTEVAAGRSGSVAYDLAASHSRVHAEFRPVRVGGWGVIVGFDEEEFLAPVRAAGRVAFGSALAALAALAAIIVLVSRRITRPLVALADTADTIATGRLDVPIAPPRTRDEVGHLAVAFARMRDDLQRYIAELATTIAAKQKIESELAIAQQIQRTMLPAPRFTLPGRRAVEISAHIQPAKTVGGDLYAYFLSGPARFGFAVGDVSDKGVPAALFMARTITLLKTAARDGAGPDEVLSRVNAELYPDNDECMFVTLFCGVLDLESGELACANAGHEPPLLVGRDGAVRLLELPAGPAVGLEPRLTLPVSRVVLAPGDTLVLYTDGVTEAVDPAGGFFGRERLVQGAAGATPAAVDLTQNLAQQLQAFSAGAAQADDITLFALRLSGPE